MSASFEPLADIERDVVACRACPRLVEWREQVARQRIRRHRECDYWGRPVPGFGDPDARVLLVGLAPGAHGSNRTGRMFTGDASGSFLYPALHRAGFASQPDARDRDDGMWLRGLWITAAARCAPPDNKPSNDELARCRPFLVREWRSLRELRVVLCLGRVAHDCALAVLRQGGATSATPSKAPFAHGAVHGIDGWPAIVDSYHVSRQNTNTGRLTQAMFDDVLRRVKALASSGRPTPRRSSGSPSDPGRPAGRR